MRAAVVHEFGSPLVVQDVPRPEPSRARCWCGWRRPGLCHTDIHAARGELAGQARAPADSRARGSRDRRGGRSERGVGYRGR